MKYIPLLIFGLLTQFLSAQSKLYYDNSAPSYVPPPIQQYKELANNAEQQYYKNRDACNQIENYILKELQKLKVDTLNVAYRNGLKDNLQRIKKIQSTDDYEMHTMEIMETAESLQKNQVNYQDENEIIRQELERKLKIQEEENKKLKKEMESKKSNKVITKKKTKK